jgi:hypothetical protein
MSLFAAGRTQMALNEAHSPTLQAKGLGSEFRWLQPAKLTFGTPWGSESERFLQQTTAVDPLGS